MVFYLIKKWSAQNCLLFQGIPLFQGPLYQGFTVIEFWPRIYESIEYSDVP